MFTIQKNMKKTLKKREEKRIMGIEETKKMIQEIALADCDPDVLFTEIGRDILPNYKDGTKGEKEKAMKMLKEKASKALMAIGMQNHLPLAETIIQKYRPLAIDFTRQLIKEYNCTTVIEKSLAQVISGSYIRILECSEALSHSIATSTISELGTAFYTMQSKELDRAERHYITALTTLQQIKAPKFDINVKAKNAFVSQNHQINNNLKPNENIEPK